MIVDARPATAFVLPRWIAWLFAWSAVAAFIGGVLTGIAQQGLANIPGALVDQLPWIAIIALALTAARMAAAGGTALALAAATVTAATAGPALVSALLRFDWVLDDNSPRFTDVEDATAEYASAISIAGSIIIMVAATMALVALVIAIARLSAIPLTAIARTPFRIEVLGSLIAMALASLAQFASVQADLSFEDLGISTVVRWLSWIVPLLVLLTLSLRWPGFQSIWIVGALALTFIALPAVSGVLGNVDLDLALNAFMALPVAIVALIVVWWNAVPQPARRSPGGIEPSWALEPWSGVAFVLAFVPLFVLPAIVLGHIAYERIEALGSTQRGRLIAASAILLAFINATAAALFAAGALGSVGSLLEGF